MPPKKQKIRDDDPTVIKPATQARTRVINWPKIPPLFSFCLWFCLSIRHLSLLFPSFTYNVLVCMISETISLVCILLLPLSCLFLQGSPIVFLYMLACSFHVKKRKSAYMGEGMRDTYCRHLRVSVSRVSLVFFMR